MLKSLQKDQEKLQQLVAIANNSGGIDNITLQLVRVDDKKRSSRAGYSPSRIGQNALAGKNNLILALIGILILFAILFVWLANPSSRQSDNPETDQDTVLQVDSEPADSINREELPRRLTQSWVLGKETPIYKDSSIVSFSKIGLLYSPDTLEIYMLPDQEWIPYDVSCFIPDSPSLVSHQEDFIMINGQIDGYTADRHQSGKFLGLGDTLVTLLSGYKTKILGQENGFNDAKYLQIQVRGYVKVEDGNSL